MGVDSAIKRWLKERYEDAWIKQMTNDPQLCNVGYAFMPQICILDYTYKIKWCPEDILSGHQYFTDVFIPEISRLFHIGATQVYLCFDRGSPINKSEEHGQRYKNLVLMPIPNDDDQILIDDTHIPINWSTFVNNKALTGDLIYYLTQKILSDTPLSSYSRSYVFSPPPECSLYLHGARVEKPNRKNPHMTVPSKELLYVRCEQSQQYHLNGVYKTSCNRSTGIVQGHRPEVLDRLLEGELAVMYYLRCNPNEDVLVVTVDGDLIFLLLLASRDRIDPITGKFRNQVFLRLKMHQTDDDHLDINRLYCTIERDPLFENVADPVLHVCICSLLSGNDYIRHYVPGVGEFNPVRHANTLKELGSYVDVGVKSKIPYPLFTFIQHTKDFGKMFDVQPRCTNPSIPTQRGNLDHCLDVDVDEEMFIKFTKMCYVERYRTIKTVRKKFGNHPSVSQIRAYLKTGKLKRNRMLVNRVSRRFARQVLWLLEYWINSYRNFCERTDSTTTYRGESYYGWSCITPGKCVSADRVSIRYPKLRVNKDDALVMVENNDDDQKFNMKKHENDSFSLVDHDVSPKIRRTPVIINDNDNTEDSK